MPRTRAGGQWTEAAFWGFIRSGLRQLSMRWPPRRDIMREGRRPYRGPDRRTKFEHRCELCGEWFKAKDIEIDHIEPAGKLTDWSDLVPFVQRLLCERENLRKTCSGCNQARRKQR